MYKTVYFSSVIYKFNSLSTMKTVAILFCIIYLVVAGGYSLSYSDQIQIEEMVGEEADPITSGT